MLRNELCKSCLCNSCMNNAEDYADGMCRECENCENEGINHVWTGCKHYESDNNQSSLVFSDKEPGRPTYDEAYYEEHDDKYLEDKYLNSMW